MLLLQPASIAGDAQPPFAVGDPMLALPNGFFFIPGAVRASAGLSTGCLACRRVLMVSWPSVASSSLAAPTKMGAAWLLLLSVWAAAFMPGQRQANERLG